MNNRYLTSIALTLACLLCACDSNPETLVTSGYDEQEMDAAIARARSQTSDTLARIVQTTSSSSPRPPEIQAHLQRPAAGTG